MAEPSRRSLLEREHGTPTPAGSYRVALLYPGSYAVAMSFLGYQVIQQAFNAHPDVACERAVLPDDVRRFRRGRGPLLTLESGRPAGGSSCLAVSLAYEPDIAGLFEILDLCGVPALRSERNAGHPAVIAGGPITMSNVLPLAPFADAVVVGDGEPAMGSLTEALLAERSRGSLLERLAEMPGIHVPAIHGDRVPAMLVAGCEHLPAVGHIYSPDAKLSDMLLVEASRGCPRYCAFCVMRAAAQPLREAQVERVQAAIEGSAAPRVGLVGAAVSEYSQLKPVLRAAVDGGRGVGISSLRADCLDDELVDLLRRGGYRTMTIAADAPSQVQRLMLKKGLRDRHLLEAARLAARHGMPQLKLYAIIGLPGEEDGDIEELAALATELQRISGRVALALSPFVPKLHTPLGDAPFAEVRALDRRIALLRKRLEGRVELRSVSPKWAFVEYRLSQGGAGVGLAAYEAWKRGGGFAAYKRAFADVAEDERRALHAAREHGLWVAAGMR